jgi:hypothetical protein
VFSNSDLDPVLIILVAIRKNKRQRAGLFLANGVQLASIDTESF